MQVTLMIIGYNAMKSVESTDILEEHNTSIFMAEDAKCTNFHTGILKSLCFACVDGGDMFL
jgi:hypothetical protein